ncbi:hypothetical protein BJG93_01070 [Paraburkholderia sprentiae WSM5005]|uniref:Uncharacterized protein n=1 Tax=Paraburkholderia sprentiae WSM5005 TaxID=754502 RepID=A0A1I9YCW1_9BURK|nr:hypothetical protein [Paraburkholderia sprentiae]APA84144.1 hypothetical protein BJG93_01070 [Paraburkholderia sprentiae WSM5005]
MTSTPLTLIEGAFALPRLRPLDHLPEPFGGDWALRPLGQRWRAGLDSLYTALLRNVCVSDQQLLSYEQWVLLDGVLIGAKRPAEAPVARATPPASEPAHAAKATRPVTQRSVPARPMRITLKPRSPRIAQRRTVWHRRRGAASACVIGCVALLAWWMADQPLAPRHIASDMLKSAQALIARRDAPAPIEARRAQHQLARPEARVIAESLAPVPALPPLPADVSAAPARIAASPQRTATRHQSAPREAVHSSAARRVLRAQTHQLGADRHAANESLRASRVQKTRFGEDEYADVTTVATMSLRDGAPLPRSAVSNKRPSNSTEWMNHMSQRRITEIPEQFAP